MKLFQKTFFIILFNMLLVLLTHNYSNLEFGWHVWNFVGAIRVGTEEKDAKNGEFWNMVCVVSNLLIWVPFSTIFVVSEVIIIEKKIPYKRVKTNSILQIFYESPVLDSPINLGVVFEQIEKSTELRDISRLSLDNFGLPALSV